MSGEQDEGPRKVEHELDCSVVLGLRQVRGEQWVLCRERGSLTDREGSETAPNGAWGIAGSGGGLGFPRVPLPRGAVSLLCLQIL